MEQEAYTAVELVTADKIFGALFDNTGPLHRRQQRRCRAGRRRRQLDLHRRPPSGQADAGRQDASCSGFVYDYDYQRHGRRHLRHVLRLPGPPPGVNDKVNFSGNNCLGSDGDLVTIGRPVLGDRQRPLCGAGGRITTARRRDAGDAGGCLRGGEVGDRRYHLRRAVRQHQSLLDRQQRHGPAWTMRRGTWTYTITGIGDADAAHQNAALSGFVYDLNYFDADQDQIPQHLLREPGPRLRRPHHDFSGNNCLGPTVDLAVAQQPVLGHCQRHLRAARSVAAAAISPTLGFRKTAAAAPSTSARPRQPDAAQQHDGRLRPGQRAGQHAASHSTPTGMDATLDLAARWVGDAAAVEGGRRIDTGRAWPGSAPLADGRARGALAAAQLPTARPPQL